MPITITREILYRTLRAVAPFMSKDETRPNLHAIGFEAGHNEHGRADLHVVATDGHTMIVARPIVAGHVVGPTARFTLPHARVESLIRALKPSKATGHRLHELIFPPDGTLLIKGWSPDDGWPYEEQAPIPSGPVAPPWRQVLPERAPVEPLKSGGRKVPGAFTLSPQYLARAGDAARLFGVEARSPRGLSLRVPASDLDAVRLDIDEPDTGSLTIVIMPMQP